MVLALSLWSVFIVLAFFAILLSLEGESIMGAPILFLPTILLATVPWGLYGLWSLFT